MRNKLSREGRILAEKGFYQMTENGEELRIKHYGIAVVEDTVIAEWEADDGTDLIKYFGITEAVKTTYPALIIPDSFGLGKRIEITSGALALLYPVETDE